MLTVSTLPSILRKRSSLAKASTMSSLSSPFSTTSTFSATEACGLKNVSQARLIPFSACAVLLLIRPIMAEDWFFLTAPPLATDLVASQRIGAVTAGMVAVVTLACVVVALTMQRQAAAGRVAAASVSDVSPVPRGDRPLR